MTKFSHGGRRDRMKAGIHPEYKDTKYICACGAEFTAKSTKDEFHVEVCSKCHPFYTGQATMQSKTGRAEKFNKKYGLKSDTNAQA